MGTGEGRFEPGSWLLFIPALVSLVVGLRLSQPSVFPDEIGSLLNARFLVGQGSPSPWWYLPGYGALLVPLAALTDDPTFLIRGAQLVNAMLLVLGASGVARSLRELVPDSSDVRRWQSAALAMMSPSYLYFAGFAIADNALVAVASWVVPATTLLSRIKTSSAIVGGFVGALVISTVHSRAIVFPIAVGMALLAAHAPGRVARCVAIVVGATIGRLLGGLAIDANGGSALSGTGRQSLASLIGDNVSIDAVMSLPGTVLGQLFAVTIGSLGLWIVGSTALWRAAQRRGDSVAPIVAVSVALVASLGISVLFTNGGTGDFALYARYFEVSIPVVVALGWLSVLGGRVPSLAIAGAVFVAGPLLVLLRGSETFDGRLQRLNVASLAPYVRFGDGLNPLVLGLLGGLTIAAFALLARRSSTIAVLGALAVFAFAVRENVEASRAFVLAVGGPPSLAESIDDWVEDRGCIGLDQTDPADFWFEENLRLHRLGLEFPFWAADEPEPPCPDLVVSSRTSIELDGWAPVAVEPGRVHWLWASADLRERRSVSPLVGSTLGAPLDRPSGTIELEVLSTSSQELVVQLTINNSGEEIFVPSSNLPAGLGGVQLGLEWRDPQAPDRRVMEPVRVGLPGLLGPGERAVVTAVIERSEVEELRLLHAGFVQEGVGWFSDINDTELVEAAR